MLKYQMGEASSSGDPAPFSNRSSITRTNMVNNDKCIFFNFIETVYNLVYMMILSFNKISWK